jgi:membrane protein
MVKKPLARLVKILSGVQTGAEHEFNRLERFAHFCVLVGKSFSRNRCPVRAAALSYASLLAMIPLLAVAISVTSSLLKTEGEEKIYGFIDKVVNSVMPPATLNTNSTTVALNVGPSVSIPLKATNSVAPVNLTTASTNVLALTNPDMTGTNGPAAAKVDESRVSTAQKEAARSIHEFIQRTQSGTLGVVGMLLLVLVAIKMLANIEETFNDIWGVTRGRSWMSRIVLYWTTITLGPLLLAFALGLASSPHFKSTTGIISSMPLIGGIIFQFVPLVLLWLVFTLVYLLVPHTKIHFSAALVGGIVGGSLWHLNNVFGFLYVSRVVSNSKIYGSLGLLPVFMMGIYFSWFILLFGAQVAYAFQNRKAYLQEKIIENVNQRGREFIALRLMTCIAQRFQLGQPPVPLQQISTELDIPGRLVQQVLQPLLAARLVTEVAGAEPAYAPARPLETINAHDVLHAIRTGTGQELPLREGPVRAEVYGEFARIEEAERAAASSLTMLALVNRAQTRMELAGPESNEKTSLGRLDV